MNGSKIVNGPVPSRHTRIIKVAPVTRAVRTALAISVTAMFLTGGGVAYAGTCTPNVSNTIYCDGSFTDTITFPDVDLTLIVGQNAPTSVTPGAGADGIDATWAGNVNVTSFADIITDGGDGIYANGSGSAMVVNNGNINTNASVPGAMAIDAVAHGDVTVINNGYAGAFGTGVYDVTAVLAESTGTGYTASVYNQRDGAIIAFTDGSGTALGIEAYAANGNVVVNNSGLLVGVSYYGIADGAFAAGDTVSVNNRGIDYAIGGTWGAGIEAQGSDLTTVSNSGTIYAAASSAYGHAFGIYATGGAGGTSVYNSGDISVLGPYATGIHAQGNGGTTTVFNAYGGNLVVGNAFTSYYATGIDASSSAANSNIVAINEGGITALSHYGSTGIQAVATGAGSTVDVSNSGTIYVNTSGKYGSSGIVASGDGNSQIFNSGVVTVAYGGQSYGLTALSFNGDATVNNVGKVDVTAASYVGSGTGIIAASSNGAAFAYNAGTLTVNGGYYGFGIQASSMTGTNVHNTGSVGVSAFKYGYGIIGTSGQGDVAISNDARASITVQSGYGSAFGIVGLSTLGNVSVNNSGDIVTTGFYQAIGVIARANDGGVSVGNGGGVQANSYLGPAIGVSAISHGGDAFVYASDTSNIQAYSNGNTAIGIDVQAGDGLASVYNQGGITVTAGQDPTAMQYSGAIGVADGIFATGDSVRVSNRGGINATGYGWAAGIEAQGDDLTVVNNVGSISATSTGSYSQAFGVYATGGAGGVQIFNSGRINAQGSYAMGIDAQAQGGDVNINNAGDVLAGNTNRTYYSTGINVATNYAASDAYVYNGGQVTALSYFGSTGIAAVAIGAGSYSSVRNAGDVYVDTAFKYATSTGIVASADATASINNGGVITVAYGGVSYGALALSFNGNANVNNTGDVDVSGALLIGYGSGLVASSSNGAANVFNSGTVTVYGGYVAQGIDASGKAGVFVLNYGSVAVDTGQYGYGILANSGEGNVFVANNGSGSVDVYSYAGSALGITGIATLGDVSITNAGNVSASGFTDTIGIFARAHDGDTAVSNNGIVASFTYVSPAIGILAHATGGNATVYSNGSISATSLGEAAIGIQALSDSGAASVNNSGDITVTADASPYVASYTGAPGAAYGILAVGGSANVSNGGDISAIGYAFAAGIYAFGGSYVSGNNSGSIIATGSASLSTSYGALLGSSGHASFNNSGSVTASAAYGAAAVGIDVQAAGLASITNSGDITATSADARGILANGVAGSSVANLGAVSVDAGVQGFGVFANSDQGNVYINNGGSGVVDVLTHAGTAIGLVGISVLGDATINTAGSVTATGGYGGAMRVIGAYARAAGNGSVTNSGDITANGYALAMGIDVQSGVQSVANNSGDIIVTTARNYSGAYGILAQTYGDYTQVGNSGSIVAQGYGSNSRVTGVFASSYGSVNVTNSGDIYAAIVGPPWAGPSRATGIFASSGTVTVSNSGSISVLDAGLDNPTTGIHALGTDDVAVDNSGGIIAETGVLAVSTDGDVTVGNEGTITAAAHFNPAIGIYGNSYGNVHITSTGDISAAGDAYAFGAVAHSGGGDVSIDNEGSLAVAGVNATGAEAVTTGSGGIARVINGGDVLIAGSTVLGAAKALHAAADGNAYIGNLGQVTVASGLGSYGAFARSENADANVGNFGTIDVAATGLGLGILTIARQGTASADNVGTIVVNGGVQASAMGIETQGYLGTNVDNSGSISAVSDYAVGIRAAAFEGAANVGNSGLVTAVSTSTHWFDEGIGILVAGQTANLVNSGEVTAIGSGRTVAVDLWGGLVTLQNTGSIVATNTYLENEIAIRSRYDGVAELMNFGDISGAIVTGGGDDQLFNGASGLWSVANHSTDFGDGADVIGNAGTIELIDAAITLDDGDDHVVNYAGGTIHLTDSAIYMGAGSGNSFTNNGTIKVSGDSLIDMGTGAGSTDAGIEPAAVPSLNAIPLVNNGVINFLDGAPDDVLTITGDLGGSGAIAIDVSLLNGTSDMLYVDGSIVNGSAQTVNVAFDQLPTTATTAIPFAHVTGNSVDGSFVPGTFTAGSVLNYNPNNFLDLQLAITSDIDPTNATDDVFSVGLDVAGLNDTGALAANVASGVQSLVNSQIGTWRQRMGVLPEKGAHDAGLGLWFRVFNDQGEVDPSHAANFGAGGNFRYDQSNSGQEVGWNVNPHDEFNFGLLLNKSEGNQHLASGFGTDRIKADTVGVYGTWISPNGYYVDASYRWINFDAALRSAGGEQVTSGDAKAINLEAGYDAWTLGDGIKITPQLQYTRTTVSHIDALHGDSATFVANGGDSSRVRLGVALSKSMHGDSGVIWTPYGSVNAVREFDGQTGFAINNAFFGSTSTEGTSAMVELGVGAQKGGFTVTGGVNWTDGGALHSFTGGQLSLRYSW